MAKGVLRLGVDAGSVALKLVVLDSAGQVLEQVYQRTLGRPIEAALEVLGSVLDRHGSDAFDLVAGTGSAGRVLCQLLGFPFVNEVICQATAIRHLHPDVRTLIEMGGQDSKLIFLPADGDSSQPISDFAMNTNCAAGTGSFLDQQASRLGIRIEEEFGRLALQSQNPPRVAGRCSVFAKSDMIHLQQQAASVQDIVAGLCLGLARNLKSNLGRGMELTPPIAFCGGVAANAGVVHAMEEVFGLQAGGLIVPPLHACTGALGALLVAQKERQGRGTNYGRPGNGSLRLEALRDYLKEARTIGHRVAPLRLPSDGRPDGSIPSRRQLEERARNGPIDAWFGLDVGSISTKAAVIDANNQVLAKIYLMTAGRPLDAVKKVLSGIGRRVDGLVRIRGAATTGSGRYLTGDFIGADLVINEITAQATAAAAIDPTVDTIFEIGGQDSKYISLDRGVVVDFEMNHACAAGTGSFLEEQAERLGIDIKTQFAPLALQSQSPIRLGERCTVFMESDMLSYQQQGAALPDLVAGLCYSIVSNYINRVVGHRRIGQRIFFQGGTAFNLGVVAAFEQFTGRTITVPPHHEVTGAIGAALLARRHQEKHASPPSRFGGFELADIQCSVRSFECPHCSNNCEINEVTIPGRDPLYYGSRCDRYNLKKDTSRDEEKIPNLFTERTRLLMRYAGIRSAKGENRPKIGLPLALSNHQLLPLWGTLLGELGFQIVLSAVSNQQVVQRGVEAVLSTPCFPVKVAHGHVLELIDKGVERIWMPSILSMGQDYAENDYNQLCPYVTSIPYQVEPAIEAAGKQVQILKPPVHLQHGPAGLFKSLKPFARELGATPKHLRQAVEKAWQAQNDFDDTCRARGRQVLAELPPGQRAVVIVSRPYNGCDMGVCLNLPDKLRKLGVLPIPMDFLDLRTNEESDDRVLRGMYWKYGQKILHAGRVIREDPRLHAVYLSNFGCGPDSFLINFFKRLMAPKPALVLEIDEHSADAGVVTRLEAFLESVGNAPGNPEPRRLPLVAVPSSNGHHRTIYIPWMGDIAYGVAAAFRAVGRSAQVIPMANEQSVEHGRRFCSGKECLPCIITAGDMIRLTQSKDFDPERSAFFMPGGSGPCRFGQYNSMHKLILDELGLPNVPVFSPSHDRDFYDVWNQVDPSFSKRAWFGVCSIELLHKALLAVRPYEQQAGQTDRVYDQWLRSACELVEKRGDTRQIAAHLRQAAQAFAAIPVDRSQSRPRIGIIGEIYVRHHDFSNNFLIRQLEELGAEASLAGFSEYMYYTNWTRQMQSWQFGSLRNWFSNFLSDRVQRNIHKRFGQALEPLLGQRVYEPPTSQVLDLADPYLDRSFEGEAVLSVGKLLELHHEGCHGVINVMPFTCMPSTIVSGLVKKLSAACHHMPALSISYDGQQDPMLHTRLEAFIHQARAYRDAATNELPVVSG